MLSLAINSNVLFTRILDFSSTFDCLNYALLRLIFGVGITLMVKIFRILSINYSIFSAIGLLWYNFLKIK